MENAEASIGRLAQSIDNLAVGNTELAKAHVELIVKHNDLLEKIASMQSVWVKLGVLDGNAALAEVARLQEVEEDYDGEHAELEQLEEMMDRHDAPRRTESGAALGLIERVQALLLQWGAPPPKAV